MPLVWRKAPDISVTLVGSHMPDAVKQLSCDRVHTVGYVPDVIDIYERCLLSVAPLRYGAGVKGKVLEAFAAGIPCVMTSCAAEGVMVDGPLRELVGDSPEAIAQKILALHADRQLAASMSEAGQTMIRDHYAAPVVDNAIAAALAVSASS
ncbi:glycosyltransferase family 4 protein [Ideonella paludis]